MRTALKSLFNRPGDIHNVHCSQYMLNGCEADSHALAAICLCPCCMGAVSSRLRISRAPP